MAEDVKRPHGFQPELPRDREVEKRATMPHPESWRAGEGRLRAWDERDERMGPVVDDRHQERGVYPGTSQESTKEE